MMAANAIEAAEKAYQKVVVDEFHRFYYDTQIWDRGRTLFCGRPIAKCPFDLHVFHELIFEIKPRLIVETGTFCGGSALFFAYQMMMAKVENPLVVTIDIEDKTGWMDFPPVRCIIGSSVADDVIATVDLLVTGRAPVMVVLDSDHSKDHVFKELEAYARLVTPGSYCVVEDTNINGHPVFPEHGPGPAEAVEEWLKTDLGQRFEVDRSREKFGVTFNPGGWLKRKE